MRRPSGPMTSTISALLCRIIVPLWVLMGALFKLVEHTPKLLPRNVFLFGVETLSVPPYLLLASLIALELFAVAVMIFLRRWRGQWPSSC